MYSIDQSDWLQRPAMAREGDTVCWVTDALLEHLAASLHDHGLVPVQQHVAAAENLQGECRQVVVHDAFGGEAAELPLSSRLPALIHLASSGHVDLAMADSSRAILAEPRLCDATWVWLSDAQGFEPSTVCVDVGSSLLWTWPASEDHEILQVRQPINSFLFAMFACIISPLHDPIIRILTFLPGGVGRFQ